MNAMRLTVPSYNPVKQCQGCSQQDENKVAAQILSYQLAHLFLKRYSGTWQIKKDEILLKLESFEQPLQFELNTGTIRYKTLRASLISRYSVEKGLSCLADDIAQDFAFPMSSAETKDDLFGLFVKLIEIYHARCGLKIVQCEKGNNLLGWELILGDEKLRGWISSEFVAENRFGERMNILEWFKLRPEKMAGYVFGFQRFCENYPTPVITIK
ncbi:hypothetical protein AAC978_01800 [Desulfitobacterium sp. THU1]|uniref:hypothetical protein n=1 Tax=Desulfitobacterium sp. THU1 TaxID=3138072 RepID=UPI00311DC35C